MEHFVRVATKLLEYQGYSIVNTDLLRSSDNFRVISGRRGDWVHAICIIILPVKKTAKLVKNIIDGISLHSPNQISVFSDDNITSIMTKMYQEYPESIGVLPTKPSVTRIADLDKLLVDLSSLTAAPKFSKVADHSLLRKEIMSYEHNPDIKYNDPENIWCDGYYGDIIEFEQLNNVSGKNIVYRKVVPD